MSELSLKSINKLELPAVLKLLEACAVGDEAKQRCRQLSPLSDADDIRALQQQTTDACSLMTLYGSPAFSQLKDVRLSLDRADRGGCLTTKELLQIADLLRCARRVKEYYDGAQGSTVLDVFFASVTPNKYLEEKISTAILAEDEISDSASKALYDIRRKIRVKSAGIKESLQKLISSPSFSKYLRDPIITMREDRYVVPVKSEFKNEIPGMIHDVSSTGATFFVEPMSSVNANNELRELQLQEKKEIERILMELSADSASHKDTIADSYLMLTELDTVFARAKLSFQMAAVPPVIRTDGVLELKNARHPLISKDTVVPISVGFSDFDALIITGPNTGGKTVTLKTLGLLTLMAECGLHIPAGSGSSVCVFRNVFADIGDEQSIEQSLSTFSAHMKNITEIVRECDDNSLVLFDELGAGTDPAEGAALAIALIDYCRKQGCKIAATTHYAELKIYAMRTEGVMNASCEFDVETLRPTYRLLIGIPGKSNAFAISRRLGLPDHIIDAAGNMLSRNDRDFEDVLHQLEVQRRQMEAAREDAERLRVEMERSKKQSDEYMAEIRKEKEKAEQKAREEAKHIIDEARATVNSVYADIKELRKKAADAADAREMNEYQAEHRRMLNEAEQKTRSDRQTPQRQKSDREIRPGDTVEVLNLGVKAQVITVGKNGKLELKAGILKINSTVDEVVLIDEQQEQIKKYIDKTKRELNFSTVKPELDLRGMDSVEASFELRNFIDSSFMANLTQVRIIHGKGTGILRKTVHEELRKNKHVKSFRLGVYGEGEDGVTIAELK